MPTRLVVQHAVILPMTPDRRILRDGYLVAEGDRIVALGEGPAPDLPGAEMIDARGAILLPGLVDTHAHAGHALTKGLGADASDWMGLAGRIYAEAADPGFWRAEAALSALERLRCGTTTAALLFGGGPDVMVSHDRAAVAAHREAVAAIGVAEILAVGPNRPAGPRRYRDWRDGRPRDVDVTPDDQLAACDDLLGVGPLGLQSLAVSLPVFSAADFARSDEALALSRRTHDLARRHGVQLVRDGHRDGTIALAEAAHGFEGIDGLFGHCVDLQEGDVAALLRSGAKVAHNPSALMSVFGRCPAPELMERGVTVALGSDAPAPDRGFDLFRILFQAHRYHARHFADDAVLPPWRLLEMATIEGARALSLAHEIGSLEPGKRADLVLVDWRKPHLWPPAEPVQRLARYATGADVATVIVAGRVLMRDRRVLTVDEESVLDEAAAAYATMLDRAGLADRFPLTVPGSPV